MSNPRRMNKRSKVYVDPEVQQMLARRVGLHWCIFLLVCFVFVGVLQGFIEHPSTSVFEMFQYAVKRNIIAMVCGVALIPLFIYDTMQVTNRFAGPIVRLRAKLRSIVAGEEFTELKIRSGDYWQDLADEFNAAVEKLSVDAPPSEPLAEEELLETLG